MSHYETLVIVCHVEIYVDFSAMMIFLGLVNFYIIV